MKLSVIIPAWNGRDYLPACLDALLAEVPASDEVLVVDNASTDGTADLVAESYPSVRLIRHARNEGFAGGCNAGLRAARGEVLALLNQDTRVQPGWRAALRAAFDNPSIDVAGCKLLRMDGRTLQHAGGYLDWPLALGHHHGDGEADGPAWSEPRPVEYVTGAALALRRAVLERVGLLDEGFWPGYYEDTDYCFLAREAGCGVWYWPAARVLHHETTSVKNPFDLARYYHRGRLRFVLKHVSPERFVREFVPAELDYHRRAMPGDSSIGLRLAYLECILAGRDLLPQRWPADPAGQRAVLAALQELYTRAWQLDWQLLHEQAFANGAAARPWTQAPPEPAPLKEYEFPPRRWPGGWIVAALQTLWYSFAARWGVRYLAQQQDRINEQQRRYAWDVGRRMAELAEENALLARYLVQHEWDASSREKP